MGPPLQQINYLYDRSLVSGAMLQNSLSTPRLEKISQGNCHPALAYCGGWYLPVDSGDRQFHKEGAVFQMFMNREPKDCGS